MGPPRKAYRRKEKSLGLLCENFLSLCQDNHGTISLDSAGAVPGAEGPFSGLAAPRGTCKASVASLFDAVPPSPALAASALQVERRRMYDVVNILEAVGLVQKRAKNAYEWLGWDNFTAEVKVRGTGATSRWQPRIRVHPPTSPALVARPQKIIAEGPGSSAAPSPEGAEGGEVGGKRPRPGSRSGSTLAGLSRRFVAQLASTAGAAVSLEAFNQRLERQGGGSGSGAQAKTQGRRLYDIANVLVSLGLVDKVTGASSSKKPCFRWRQPSGPPPKRPRLGEAPPAHGNSLATATPSDRDPFGMPWSPTGGLCDESCALLVEALTGRAAPAAGSVPSAAAAGEGGARGSMASPPAGPALERAEAQGWAGAPKPGQATPATVPVQAARRRRKSAPTAARC